MALWVIDRIRACTNKQKYSALLDVIGDSTYAILFLRVTRPHISHLGTGSNEDSSPLSRLALIAAPPYAVATAENL